MKRVHIFFVFFCCFFGLIHAFDNLKFHTLSNKGGLSYDGIIDIKQDGRGFVWILLEENIFRFDGYTYKSYKDCFRNGSEAPLGYFNNLATDGNGTLFACISHGVYQYDHTTDRFTKIIDAPVHQFYIDHKNRFWSSSDKGFSFTEEGKKPFIPDYKGNNASQNKRMICENGDDLYFFSQYGKIYRFDSTGMVIDAWINIEKDFENALLVDATIKNGAIWILTNRFSILKIDLQTGKISYRYTCADHTNSGIRRLYVSDKGIAWIGGIDGLYLLNTETDEIRHYRNDANDHFSLPNNSVWTIYEDNQKNVWIGTYMGSLAYVNRNEKKMFETFSLSRYGLNKAPVSGFTEAGDRIWISTEGGGINILDRATHNFTYLQNTGGANSLSSNNTKTSVIDKEGNFWVATFRGGLNRYNPETKQFTYFRKQGNDVHSLYSDNLRKIILEPDSGLWVFYQAHSTTISFFSFRENRFVHQTIDEELNNSMRFDYIYDAYKDNGNRLWIITSSWLFSLDTKSKQWQKHPIPAHHNPASTLCVDDDGKVWIGTFGNELLRFDPEEGSFLSFPGILQSRIAEIYSLNQSVNRVGEQVLWLGTNDGLYMFNTETRSCVLFRESDGTQGDVYYPLSTFKDKNGFLYFGGTGGFTIIDPQKVVLNPLKPKAVITDFYIDYQSVFSDSTRKDAGVFSNDLSTITLNHTQQNIGFELSSDNYLNSDKNLFRYRLKNYDNRWIQTDATNREIFYTKIPAGKREFEFQTANNDGIWGDISSIEIIRKQAPWATTPAIILYFLFFCFLLYYFINAYNTRKKLELKLYLDRVEKEKNEEIHNNQLQFFTNISHDLKTPLSLIMITINKMREEGMREYYYRILNSNSERLLRLLSDILDFGKIRNSVVSLSVSKANLSEFIQVISGDFMEFANQKKINYQIVTGDEELSDVPFDKKVMEKIIMNLLINAFRYTRKGDSISVTAGVKAFISKYAHSYSIGYDTLNDRDTFSIVISDTGVGISKESIAKVFNRFYQVASDNLQNQMSTGIGLALVKDLVLLHKGSITVYSEQDAGSDFVVKLSSSILHYLPGEIQTEDVAFSETGETPTGIEPAQDYPESSYKTDVADLPTAEEELKEKTILLAENNIDLRAIIKDSLLKKYNVVDFNDGQEALAFLKDHDADLIISDIMMPNVDGITFCKTVKSNRDTSHIPFVMLTAKSGTESMLEGTESGADLYFEKPTDLTLLKTAIANIFKQQEVLRAYYAKNYFAEISNVSSNKEDSLFLKEITEIIEEHLDQSTLDVNTIATTLKISRSKLYSKLKALTGKSMVEFILSYRLRRAAKLLVESNMNVQQAMYAVGIESQSYFAKAFKKEFNMTPSKFVQHQKTKGGRQETED